MAIITLTISLLKFFRVRWYTTKYAGMVKMHSFQLKSTPQSMVLTH